MVGHPFYFPSSAQVHIFQLSRLISASVASVVYYAFSCRKVAFSIYLSLTIFAGIAGSILPFMQWFNERKYKVRFTAR